MARTCSGCGAHIGWNESVCKEAGREYHYSCAPGNRPADSMQPNIPVIKISTEESESSSGASRGSLRWIAILLLVAAIGAYAVSRDSGSSYSPPTVGSTFFNEAGRTRDVSYGRVTRYEYAITIPSGRTRAEVEATLRHAAETIGRREQPDALIVNAYRQGEPASGVYSVGQAIWAPGGLWENARQGGAKSVSVKLGELYFQDTPRLYASGETVKVQPEGEETAVLSDSYEDWGAGRIIAELPAGALVVVLDNKSEVITPEYVLTRYRVRATVRGRAVTGWMHAFDLGDQ